MDDKICSASAPIVDILRQRSRPYLFSNAVAPSVVGKGEADNCPARVGLIYVSLGWSFAEGV